MAKNQPQGFATDDNLVADEHEALPVIPVEELALDKYEIGEARHELPVGIFWEGERLRDFTLLPYKTKYDRILGQLLQAPKVKIAQVLGNFLPQIVSTIGGYDVKDLAGKMSMSAPRMIENMFLGDVLTMVLAIRLEAQGESIAMSAQCPNCGTQNDDDPARGRPYHDLSSVEVTAIRDLGSKPIVEVTLPDGLQVMSDVCHKIHMQPLRLFQVDKLSAAGSGIPVDIALMYNMITGIPEAESLKHARGQIMTDVLYDELTRNDLAALRKAVEKIQPGPDMNADMSCIQCGHEWKSPVPWGNLRQFLFVSAESVSAA